MTQRRLRNRNDFNHSKQQIIEKMLHWTLVVIMVFQQLKTTAAVKFKGDNCSTKNQAGVCKEWSECPIIKTLIESGEYTNREVVSCGFGVREELICCPVRTEPKIESTTSKSGDRSGELPTTAGTPVKDFWLDLLPNTTSSTTATPDFWLDLLTTTAIPIIKVTTPKPLIIGEQRLNESSEFFDLNALLSQQNGANKQQRQNDFVGSQSNNNSPSQAALKGNGNGHGDNFNTGPVNINQWGLNQMPNNLNNGVGIANFNNGRGNNGHPQFGGNGNGNFVWGQQNNGRSPFNGQLGLNRGHNNGQGHGHGNFNGRGPHSNGRFRNSLGVENQGFGFPQNNARNNNFFGQQDESFRPGRPVNNIQEQVHIIPNINNNNKRNDEQTNDDNNDKRLDDIIKNVFTTSEFEEDNSNEKKNTFNFNKPQRPLLNNPQILSNPQPVVWVTPQGTTTNNNKQFIEVPSMRHQTHFIRPQFPAQYEIITAEDNQMNSNDLTAAASTNFIQQPVVVQTWPGSAAPSPHFNPVEVVYQNLVDSGMDIVKAQENQLQPVINPPPSQVVFVQPQEPMQQFVQQTPQIIYQQPQSMPNFGEENSQLLQMETAGKAPRSTSTMQQFVQQPNPNTILNVQSPPNHILDPFKPFEFRPPRVEENGFIEDNNSLSPNPSPRPDPKPSNDRPAVRACRRIEKGLPGSLSQHILGGTPAELGEFPHMAAIGYSRIGGGDLPPYDIRCGGTLIDKRFVLTAAHCVSDRESVPSIVRLGVVDFKNEEQMSAAVEVRIKQVHIHDEYRTRLTYNDIAVLELERDVKYSLFVYPVCLYTDLKDPDSDIRLWVTGWGTINTTTRSFSEILLKAPLHTAPLEKCNQSFVEYGLNRRVPEGIIKTQFCAEDKDQIKDACQGDSGGPLNLVVDESYNNYRLVGVVSAGFGCGSSTPGLYTRVAAFLDFIEKIVWPNGGD